jgi:myo-inositol-1(or 4)-monophosphatase
MHNTSGNQILERIKEALVTAGDALSRFTPGAVHADQKSSGRGPVTEADRVTNQVLREVLVRDGEGWLSEESEDNLERLKKQRVWVVDPLDGTLEFTAGIPEWCVSVGMVENGQAVAGGIFNPATGEIFLGSLENGATYNGRPVRASSKDTLEGAVVLASRSEVKRGDWKRFERASFVIRPKGSAAYKLGLVAAGLADATWTLSPKNEWDVAAGVALVEASGGFVRALGNSSLRFNNRSSLVPGLLAGGRGLCTKITSLLDRVMQTPMSSSNLRS